MRDHSGRRYETENEMRGVTATLVTAAIVAGLAVALRYASATNGERRVPFDDEVRAACVAGGVVDAYKPDGKRDGRLQFYTCGVRVK